MYCPINSDINSKYNKVKDISENSSDSESYSSYSGVDYDNDHLQIEELNQIYRNTLFN